MAQANKPKKPNGFPLTPHSNGQWVKKLRGRSHYFGPWDDPEGAVEQFNHDWPYICKGQVPPPMDAGDTVTVEYLCNAYLQYREAHVDAGELTRRTWHEFKKVAKFVAKQFGPHRPVSSLGPADFTSLHREAKLVWGKTRINNFVSYTKTMFARASDALELIGHEPKYGYSFRGLSRADRRQIKIARGPLMFEGESARRLIVASSPAMKAMILLGLNAAFTNIDCARLPLSLVDLKNALIDFPREKSHTLRRVMLWPETVKALQAVIENDKKPKAKERAHMGLVFITRYGRPWVIDTERVTDDEKTIATHDDAIAKEFRKTLDALNLHSKGLGFSALRKTFRTYADEVGDQPAVNLVMGHISGDMGDWYVQRIEDERLRKVVNHVRNRLELDKLTSPDSSAQTGDESAAAAAADEGNSQVVEPPAAA